MEQAQNFSLVEKHSQFTKSDLVFKTKGNRIIPMIGLPKEEKIRQVHYRQDQILDNYRRIISLTTKKKFFKTMDVASVDKIIQRDTNRISSLHVEIAKVRAAAIIDRHGEISDSPDYQEFLRVAESDPFVKLNKISVQTLVDHELIERILLENPDLIAKFVGQVLTQGDEKDVIKTLTKVSQKFGYKLSKDKEIAQ